MKFTPNLGPRYRILYVVLGAVLVVAPLGLSFLAEFGWLRIALPVVGAVWLLTGASGW